MNEYEVEKLPLGTRVIPNFGPNQGKTGSVIKKHQHIASTFLEVRFNDGTTSKFLGQELDRVRATQREPREPAIMAPESDA